MLTEGKGKTEKCLQNCSQKTYTQILVSIHIFQISNKLELNLEGLLQKINGSFCKDTILDARICFVLVILICAWVSQCPPFCSLFYSSYFD